MKMMVCAQRTDRDLVVEFGVSRCVIEGRFGVLFWTFFCVL